MATYYICSEQYEASAPERAAYEIAWDAAAAAGERYDRIATIARAAIAIADARWDAYRVSGFARSEQIAYENATIAVAAIATPKDAAWDAYRTAQAERRVAWVAYCDAYPALRDEAIKYGSYPA